MLWACVGERVLQRACAADSREGRRNRAADQIEHHMLPGRRMKRPFADAGPIAPPARPKSSTRRPHAPRPHRPAARAHPLAPRSRAANPSCGPGFVGTCQVVMEFSQGVARGDAQWFQLCAFTPGDGTPTFPTSRARGTASSSARRRPPSRGPTAPASLASKLGSGSSTAPRRADAAGAPPAVGLPPAAQGARRGRGRAGWRSPSSRSRSSASRRARRWPRRRRDSGRRIVAGAAPAPRHPAATHARAPHPAAAAAGRRRRGGAAAGRRAQLLAATTRLLQEQVLNSGG